MITSTQSSSDKHHATPARDEQRTLSVFLLYLHQLLMRTCRKHTGEYDVTGAVTFGEHVMQTVSIILGTAHDQSSAELEQFGSQRFFHVDEQFL